MEKNTADQTEHLAAVKHFGEQQQEAENRVHAHVIMARISGASWVQIGAALGISKQTAHARYNDDVRDERKTRYAAADAAGSNATKVPSKISDPDVAGTSETPSKISDTDVAGTSETPSIFSDAAAPANSVLDINFQIAGTADRLGRIKYAIPNPDTTAQPGIGGNAPHQCPNCKDTNHKTEWRNLAAFDGACTPTKYDPPKIATLMKAILK